MTGDEALDELQERIGYEFREPALLRKAMTHASYPANERISYERLEFVGDAVVSVVVAERLFRAPGRLSEGEMTVIKSQAVSSRSMERAGRRLGLADCLFVDMSLAQTGDYPASVITDAYEALIGAVFLDGGFDRAREVVLSSLAEEIEDAEQRRHAPNHKSLLQQFVQAEGMGPPTYGTVDRVGPEHDSRFRAAVYIGDEQRGKGWGTTKKDAEQQAAQAALDAMYPGWQKDDENETDLQGPSASCTR